MSSSESGQGEALSAQRLIEVAVDETKLDDFGDSAWRDGLEALIDSAAKEANLNSIGLSILISWSKRRLTNRLKVIDWVKRHPEIRDEKIETPIIVLGMLRTGTTILCELLARDPGNRPLMKWEGLESTPPPRHETLKTDPRIQEMIDTVEFQMQVATEMRAVHYEPGDGPTECVALLTQSFRAQDLACGPFRVPSFLEWYRGCDFRPAYDYHRLSLQLLQSGGVRGRWSLKAPAHMHALDDLLAVYPDARLIITHRDPVKTVGSAMTLSMAAIPTTLHHDMSEANAHAYYGKMWTDELDLMVKRMMDFRNRNPGVQVFDLCFDDFMGDPVGSVRKAYAHFGETLSSAAEVAMRDHLARNPRGQHGGNAYTLDDFGIDADRVRDRFAPYVDRFGVVSGV